MKLFSCILVLGIAALSRARDGQADESANWPHWRGPLMNGAAPDAQPPLEWSEEKNIKWKAPIPGEGNATPIVWGNRIFVLTAVQTNRKPKNPPPKFTGELGRTSLPTPEYILQFEVICYDRDTGDVVWRRTATEQAPHEGIQQTNSFASASPMTDGERLYVSFGSRGIFCYTLDGEFVWKRDLGDLHTRKGFGEGASPFIYKDSLIVPWDHEGPSALYCLDANTGETKWKADREGATNWNTPVVVEWEGTEQVIVNGIRTISYDLSNGETLWECGGQTGSCIPTTIIDGGAAICISGWNAAAACAIPLGVRGDATDSEALLWTSNKDTPYVPCALLYEDKLYFTKRVSTVFTCLNAKTGETVIQGTRLPGLLGTIYASPVGAANRVYFMTREGQTLVIKSGDAVEELALNELDDVFDASPVMIGKQILLRGRDYLYCIEED